MMIAQEKSMSKLTSKKMIFKASMGHKFINKQSLITKMQAITYSLKSPVNLFRAIWILGKRQGNATCGGYVSGMFGFFFTEGLFTTLDLCESRFPMQVQS